MTYELAKQLKDAGFSFVVYLFHGKAKEPYIIQNTTELDGITYFLPTLSELIEACPRQFGTRGVFTLASSNGGENWAASYHDFLKNNSWFHFFGPTPEEAVARLWLALNKK